MSSPANVPTQRKWKKRKRRKGNAHRQCHLVDNGAVGTQTGQTRLEDSSMNVDPAEVTEVEEEEPKPTQFRIANPSRITKSQADVCVFDTHQAERYRPRE
jgi:hypothetical protein